MALPIPPTNPNLTIPSRVGDNNRRLRRREGTALPTPRTYTYTADGNLGTTTLSNTLTLATFSGIFLQPREALGVLLWVDVVSSVASTVGRLWVDSPSLSLNSAQLIRQTFGTTRVTYGGDGTDLSGTSGDSYSGTGDAGTKITWLHSFWDGSAEVGAVTSPTAISVGVKLARISGTGNLTAHNLRAKFIVM